MKKKKSSIKPLTLKQFEKALKTAERIERIDLISGIMDDLIQEMEEERVKKIVDSFKK